MKTRIQKNWRKPQVNKFSGFLFVTFGIITFVVGFGAWQRPHLDWVVLTESFTSIFSFITGEMYRMAKDPFAFIGLIVMIAGIIVIINGIKRLYSKKALKFEL